MTALASASGIAAFDVDGTHFYGQKDRPDTLYYLPGAPVPELDAQSRPTLMLLRMPQASILQLGAQFTLTAADQSAALAKIAARQPAFASARLQPAPISVQKAAVSMADATGKVVELKSTVSSGFPPYAAIFSITLTPDQAAQAIAAVNGRAGLLFVDYVIALPAAVAATLDGAPTSLLRRTDVASWFPAGDGMSHLRLAG